MNNKFGQHFINNKDIINLFIKIIDPKIYENFLEIGPGNGNITKHILKYIKNIILVEIDKNLYNKLNIYFKNIKNNIFILNLDARNLNIKNIFYKLNFIKNKKLRIFSSLPYYCSTKIILNLCKYNYYIKDMYFILQKELSEKLLCNNKNISKNSLIINLYFKTYIIYKKIYSNHFKPEPNNKIVSYIIKMIPKKNKFSKIFIYNFIFIINNIFNKKRKTIKNNLKNFFSIDEFKKYNINYNLRAQDLTFKDYCLLTKNFINK